VSYTALPTKNPGDLLTAALWNTYLQGNADSGFMRLLGRSVLAAPLGSITFTGIPATFGDLELSMYSRTTSGTATSDVVAVQFNGDSGADYDSQHGLINGTTLAATQLFGQTSGLIGTSTGGAAPAGLFASCRAWIPAYASANANKAYLTQYGAKWGVAAGNLEICVDAGFWRSNAAINQITLIPSAGSFAIGSIFSLWGNPV
jgi:hypothetical protein